MFTPGPCHQGRLLLLDCQPRAAPLRHVTDSLRADGRFKTREAVGHAFVEGNCTSTPASSALRASRSASLGMVSWLALALRFHQDSADSRPMGNRVSMKTGIASTLIAACAVLARARGLNNRKKRTQVGEIPVRSLGCIWQCLVLQYCVGSSASETQRA